MTASKDLVTRARTGRLRGSEVSDSTITVQRLAGVAPFHAGQCVQFAVRGIRDGSCRPFRGRVRPGPRFLLLGRELGY
ncbi:hypothetical protein ACIOC2_24940 [Streptomyces sp. NPDC088337]|uniref:hypothetical protein n=1 Tax=unclassified Streptomyces TaxID=2593676 RepID=UPI002DDAA129|nr:hypothetical protein [Streptomyces sp. NBC_01788]WSB25210.1 hypothetical protein OIE49_04565 [Streptomyces sp. NBC_01788]